MGSKRNMRALPILAKERGGAPSSFLLELLQTVLVAVFLYAGVGLVTDRVRVENISMQPTLYENDLLLINRVIYDTRPPEYGEVIVFHHQKDPPEDYVKRVIGLPGDVVEVEDGQVLVNGAPLNEPYIKEAPNYEGVWIVPPEQLFVLGDNRNLSSDSRVWGFVPLEDVVGRAELIYWPPREVNLLRPPEPAVSAAN